MNLLPNINVTSIYLALEKTCVFYPNGKTVRKRKTISMMRNGQKFVYQGEVRGPTARVSRDNNAEVAVMLTGKRCYSYCAAKNFKGIRNTQHATLKCKLKHTFKGLCLFFLATHTINAQNPENRSKHNSSQTFYWQAQVPLQHSCRATLTQLGLLALPGEQNSY